MVFKKAAEVISNVVSHIEESQELCGKSKTEQGSTSPAQQSRNKQQYQRAKEQLTNESRQFVTASKLFVKSATESEGQLMECLNHCVQMIDRIGNVTRDVAMLTPTPLQTQTLLAKVRDVADTYLQTVQAA
jgi:glutaredoxin 2